MNPKEELNQLIQRLNHLLRQQQQLTSYLIQVYLAAMTYYTYNEVSFMALDNISPISHALASTLRRVFIITSSMMVFGNKMTPLGALGSSMAVGGALLYSAAKNHYKKLASSTANKWRISKYDTRSRKKINGKLLTTMTGIQIMTQYLPTSLVAEN